MHKTTKKYLIYFYVNILVTIFLYIKNKISCLKTQNYYFFFKFIYKNVNGLQNIVCEKSVITKVHNFWIFFEKFLYSMCFKLKKKVFLKVFKLYGPQIFSKIALKTTLSFWEKKNSSKKIHIFWISKRLMLF